MFRSLRLDQYLVLICGTLVILLFPNITLSSQLNPANQTIKQIDVLPILDNSTPIPVPLAESVALSSPDMSAKSAIVVDLGSGSTLFQKNAYEKLPQASLTKLMTAYTARKLYPPNDIISVSPNDLTTGNVMDLQPGEVITVQSLLEGLLVYSANDAALALSNHDPAGSLSFMNKMNTHAQALHLNQTAFKNPTGFDQFGHYSSAWDIAQLAKVVMQDEMLYQFLTTKQTKISSLDGNITHQLVSTNELLGVDPNVIGGKTGSTLLAGECLMTMSNIGGHTVLTVVMGSSNRFDDTSNLLNWVYNRYNWIN